MESYRGKEKISVNETCLKNGLIEHCAPTLAGMKCAGLFNYFYCEGQKVREEMEELNQLLNDKGVSVDALAWKENSVLVYVYRRGMLEKELRSRGVSEFLKTYGYAGCEVEASLKCLKARMKQSSCFPHEIGIFLGYPLEDVCGFIANGGKNCKSCGMWKVYCRKEEKERLFKKFRKCKEVYMQVFFEGRELKQMTVRT